MKTLYQELLALRQQDKKSFHMPGHKYGGSGLRERFLRYGGDFLDIDMTEIPGSDNLHHAEGIIQKAQTFAADFYGAQATHFLVNGATSGIMAMIMGCFNRGDAVVVCRDAHRSIHHAIMLGGLKPIYVMPLVCFREIAVGIDPEAVEKAYEQHPEIKGVIATYPSYSGACTDLKAVAAIVHRYQGLLLVDEAHGAHLPLSEALPLSALELGADVVIQSVHKTLPAMTQTALLHIGSSAVPADRIRYYLAILQTSSPSYVLMASIDEAVHIAAEEGKDRMLWLLKRIDRLKHISRETGLEVLDLNALKACSSQMSYSIGALNWDQTKICLSGGRYEKVGLDGYRLEEALMAVGIQPEYSVQSHVLLMTSIGNSDSDFDQLERAIVAIGQSWQAKVTLENLVGTDERQADLSETYLVKEGTKIPELVYLPCDMQEIPHSEWEQMSYQEAVGMVAAEFIIPYPPGIPMLMPGERIEQRHVQLIEAYLKNNHPVLGVEQYKINVIIKKM